MGWRVEVGLGAAGTFGVLVLLFGQCGLERVVLVAGYFAVDTVVRLQYFGKKSGGMVVDIPMVRIWCL